jgi:hypothetical protein
VLFSYAVEELGKAAMLADLVGGTDDPVSVHGFYDHEPKLLRAESLLGGPVVLRLGFFQRNAFQRNVFDVGVLASDLDDRLDLLYVDWKDARWRLEPTTDAARLEKEIGSVRTAIAKGRTDWLAGAN